MNNKSSRYFKPLLTAAVPMACAVLAVAIPGPARAFSSLAGGMTYGLSGTMPHQTLLVRSAGQEDLQSAQQSPKIGAGAQSFIEAMGRRAIGFLGNGGLTPDQKKAQFRTLLNDSFDMETIGRFALGRYWNTTSPDQRREYQKLFRDMIVEIYSHRFEDYKGQKFETRGFRADGEKDNIVTSFIIPAEGAEVQVDWRVRYKSGRYQIVDVIVEGVSMSVTQRSDFSAVIQRGGGDVRALLTHLRGL